MKDNANLLQIERNILEVLTAFQQPPDLPEIAEKLGFTTNAGHIKLSYYVDNLERDGFVKYNRAWRHSDVFNENSLGWNLTSKGRTYLTEHDEGYGLS